MIEDRTLTLTRKIEIAPEALYRCWTEPALLMQWFTPAPWKTASAEVDVRPGGSSRITMQSPEGESFPNSGIYLDVVANRRLVFTDAFTSAWVPSEKPFIVAEINFEPDGKGGTNYSAIVRHWSIADRETHENMGFHEGWAKATDQLEALARTL